MPLVRFSSPGWFSCTDFQSILNDFA
jgi:hypothetical protein